MKRLHPDIIPIVLMRWESYAVLQCITKRITRDYPEVPIFTIHDSIVTTKDHANLISSIICEELKATFRLNGLPYTLLKRNEVVALYGIGGTYTDKILHYEVCKIYIRKDKYGIRESIPSNERFGRDPSRSFNDFESASKYFDELTTRLKLCQGVLKVVSEVQENAEVMSEY